MCDKNNNFLFGFVLETASTYSEFMLDTLLHDYILNM